MACLKYGKDECGKEILELVKLSPEMEDSAEILSPDASGRPYKGENTVVMMEWEIPYMRALADALTIKGGDEVLEIGFGCGYSADRIQELRPRGHTIVECAPAVLSRLRVWADGRPGVHVVEGYWQLSLPILGKFDAIFFDDFPLPGTPDSSDLKGPTSRWHAFIDLCVAHHLLPGGRITGYLARPLSLSRPDCECAPLIPFPVDVPENCPYFPFKEAYIPLITCRQRRKGGLVPLEGGGGCGQDGGDSVLLPLSDGLGLGSGGKEERGMLRKRQKRRAFEAMVKYSLGLEDEWPENNA
ncbi:unnamed protein product [Choristocarpus tenellus]